MSDERFNRIEERLERVETGQQALRGEVGSLSGAVGALKQRVGELDSRVDNLDRRVTGLDRRVDDLDRHMHVLHEDVIARIAAIPEYTGPTKAEMNQGFAEIKEMIGRRLDPLEATVRQHSIDIARLKRDRK